MKKLIIICSMAILASCGQSSTKQNPAIKPTAKTTYTCTMHPEVKSEKPGVCPKCGMDLVEVER